MRTHLQQSIAALLNLLTLRGGEHGGFIDQAVGVMQLTVYGLFEGIGEFAPDCFTNLASVLERIEPLVVLVLLKVGFRSDFVRYKNLDGLCLTNSINTTDSLFQQIGIFR